MIIKVNIVELSAKLAEKEVKEHFKDNQEKIYYQNFVNRNVHYTEEAQELFEKFYEEYWDLICEFEENE